MEVANPLNELDDLSGDESGQSDGTREEELRSDPSDSEGASTQPTKKPHSKRGYIPTND
jgi:hypothetical protein